MDSRRLAGLTTGGSVSISFIVECALGTIQTTQKLGVHARPLGVYLSFCVCSRIASVAVRVSASLLCRRGPGVRERFLAGHCQLLVGFL